MNIHEKNILELKETLAFIAKAGGFTPMDTKTLAEMKARAKGWESQLCITQVRWERQGIFVDFESFGVYTVMAFHFGEALDYVETATAKMERMEEGIKLRHPEFVTGPKAERTERQENAIQAFFECLEKIEAEELKAERWNTIIIGDMVSNDYYRRNGIG